YQRSWVSRSIKLLIRIQIQHFRIPRQIPIHLKHVEIKPGPEKMCFSNKVPITLKLILTLLIVFEEDIYISDFLPLPGPVAGSSCTFSVKNSTGVAVYHVVGVHRSFRHHLGIGMEIRVKLKDIVFEIRGLLPVLVHRNSISGLQVNKFFASGQSRHQDYYQYFYIVLHRVIPLRLIGDIYSYGIGSVRSISQPPSTGGSEIVTRAAFRKTDRSYWVYARRQIRDGNEVLTGHIYSDLLQLPFRNQFLREVITQLNVL